jgi:nucleoid DNA-binding protein
LHPNNFIRKGEKIMEITREQLIRKVAEESGYYQKDVRRVFNALEEVILECFGEVTEDKPISIRVLQGLALNGYVVPERERVNPQDQSPIVCPPTVKASARYSDLFKKKIQERYEEKAE